jgi:signal transduction histidine kinase/ActR/RegA family two-component response regulator
MNGQRACPRRDEVTHKRLRLNAMSQDPYKIYRTIARLGSVVLLLLGALVLLGWLGKIELLTTFLPGRITMKPNTAIGFLFLGLALFLLTRYSKARSTQLWCAASATVAVLVGVLTLSEYLFHVDLGIDQFLFKDLVQSPYPGRMAHITAFNFCLAGLSVLLFAFSEKRANLSQALAAVTGLSSIFAIIGYLYGVPLLYGSIEYTSMALHTGVGFLIGSLSVLFCRPDLGLMSVLTNPYPGGWLARKLLPVAALAPAGLGAVCIHSGLFSSDVRLNIACLVVSQIVLFMALVWVLAFVLNRAEAEKAAAQEALARSEKLLQQSQKMEAIGLLAGGVAHDFNNLLAVINGYSDLLLERLDLPAVDRRSLEQIKQAGSSAATLTRQLLMLSRQQVVEPVVLNINQTVGNLDKMLRRLIKENIQFSFVLDPQLDRVKADPGQIEQIVLNLVVNARDAMPNGGSLRIQTKNVEKSNSQAGPAASPSRFVLLEVTDTGTGMDQQTQAHIFEPFFTTKAVGKGTGLGLATVYGIVKQSGGHIEVQSTPGRGSSFQIYLPAEAQACAVLETGKDATEPVFSGETILVVEDAAPLRDLVCQALTVAGCTVLSAPEAQEALRILNQQKGVIDLLITDVIMPGMNGPALAKQVRALRPETKILYMTGYSGEFVRSDMLIPGVSFIQKPFTPADLRRKIRKMLADKAAPATKAAAAGSAG